MLNDQMYYILSLAQDGVTQSKGIRLTFWYLDIKIPAVWIPDTCKWIQIVIIQHIYKANNLGASVRNEMKYLKQ